MHRTAVLFLLSALLLDAGNSYGEETAGPKTRAASARRPRIEREAGVSAGSLHAVSLRALQATLATCMPAGKCPPQALSFGGLTSLLGFALDPDRADVVVFGRIDPRSPEIRVEDFVVALRSSWRRYARRQGNVLTYAYPGCDIRPEPGVVRRLDQVERRLFSSRSPGETEAVLRAFRETCELPQKVTVLGVPFDSHFGSVMVAADSAMKRLADGSDDPRLLGFPSLGELERRTAEQAVLSHRPLAQRASRNRFWLTPGRQVYETGEGITWLRSCPVRILTHKSGATAEGELVDIGGGDPVAERFAAGFSAFYDQVAAQRRVYRELKNLFEIFALTQLLSVEEAPARAGLRLDYLLDSYPLPERRVAREIPGHPVVQRFQHTEKRPDGSETVQLWLPSCGGVDMRIEPNLDQLRRAFSKALSRLRKAMLEGQPSQLRIVRPISLPRDLLWQTQQSRELEPLNQPGSPVFVRLYDQGSQYALVSDRFQAIYEGLDDSLIAEKIAARMAEQGTNSVYVELNDFKASKASLFRRQHDLRLAQLRPGARILYLEDAAGTSVETALTRPLRDVKVVESPRLVSPGLFRAVLGYAVETGKRIVRVTLTLFADSAELLDSFVRTFGVSSALADSLPGSAAERIERTWRQLEREYGAQIRTLRIKLQTEAGQAHWVELLQPRGERAA